MAMAASSEMKMGSARIGPSAWRNNTLAEIKLTQNVIRKSDKSNELGRSMDPLPHLREIVAELSNDEAHRYFRQTRAVVCLLRESLLDTNEEIKSLTRNKEALEKAIEHIRKDLYLNTECNEIRKSRPSREKDHDGADDLLHAERHHLFNLKRMLESQLQQVQRQLQVLDKSRSRLSAVTQERSRVLDLVCAAIPSCGNSSALTSRTPRHRNRMAMSADGDKFGSEAPCIDPLGPYTPEADSALQEAKDARNRSAMLRKESADLIGKTSGTQQQAHRAVNSGLNGKINETLGLKQNLHVASGETKHAMHRAQRWFDATERSWNFSKGPAASADLTVRERLNRPVIRVFQRHPGTNLPEAQHIIRGGNGLLDSLRETSRNIGTLNLTQMRLRDDIRDKGAALGVDSGVLRMRRRKANHRWAMGEAF